MASFADKIRCPHCLEELDYLEDPKELPCSHVFCMPCLESITSEIEEGVQVKCSICRTTHNIITLSLFESARDKSRMADLLTASDSQADPEDQEPVISCDKCEKNAVSYCAECDWKLCSNHEELHQQFFIEETTSHKLISIQSYSTKVNIYVKPLCPTHGKEYAMCCKHCFNLVCQKCTADSKCTPSPDGDTKDQDKGSGHCYHTLTDATTQLKKHFEKLLRDCSKKLTDMCKLEKQTWQELDETNEACDELIEKVNTKSEELVFAVRSEQNSLVDEIMAFKTLQNKNVECQLEKNRANRETLGDVMVNCDQFVKTNHIVKIIAEKQERQSKLLSIVPICGELALGRTKIDQHLWEDYLKHYMNLNLTSVAVPQYLEYLDTIHTGGRCYDLQFVNGDLRLGNHDGIRIYSRYNNGFKTTSSNEPHVNSIAAVSGNTKRLYFVSSGTVADTKTVYECDVQPHKGTPTKLFCFDFKGNYVSRIAASESFVAATGNQELIIFDLKTKKQQIFKKRYNPGHLHFISEELLLITGGSTLQLKSSRSHLVRLKVEEEGMHQEAIWSSKYIPGIQGVCTTDNGLIAVQSRSDKAIHILSPLGKTLRTLRHDSLLDSWGGISIHGDILAVACPEQDKFQLFRLY